MSDRARIAGIVVAIGLLLALGWMTVDRTSTPEAAPEDGPRPSQTRAGRAHLERAARPKPPTEPTPASAAPVVLTVQVGDWRPWVYDPSTGQRGLSSAFSISSASPTMGWPAIDEAPWPDHPVADAVLEAVAGEDVDLDELVELAADAGIAIDAPDLVDRPWDALLAMEIERRRIAAEGREARKVWKEGGKQGQRPKDDYSAILDLAEGLIAEHPDRAVADYARMFAIYAYETPGSEQANLADLADAGMEVVENSPDPLVVDLAVRSLSNAGDPLDLEPDELDLLRAVYEDPEANIPRRQLADVAMRSALDAKDVDRASWWVARHRERIPDICPGKDTEHHRNFCDGLELAQTAAESWVAARRDIPHPTWQTALTAAVRRCAIETPPDATIQGTGAFSATWTWVDWSTKSAITRCVQGAQIGEPLPPEGQRVHLIILPGG